MNKLILVLNTVKHLRISQIFWQVFNRIRLKCHIRDEKNDICVEKLGFIQEPVVASKFMEPSAFCFLNLSVTFQEEIDWNFNKFGKLWTYNLEYFDYLLQDDVSLISRIKLVNDFYTFSLKANRGLEPYPVSLRVINIIRFSLKNNLDKEKYLDFTYQELRYLANHCEFHLLGNHLLENVFSLLLGGAFFGEIVWVIRASKILKRELKEQILQDGGHFELSPMYHSIIFYRVLELIDWYRNYSKKDQGLLLLCIDAAEKMRSWLENMQFDNGDLPLFNDAAKYIAFDSGFLLTYADRLDIKSSQISLGESGYRSFRGNKYEVRIDVADIGAKYQPGHAHADALSFILYYEREPLFVEQGTSTYELGTRRNLERSSNAHNTVIIDNKDQSEVWGGFRVGNRAQVDILKDDWNNLEASHNGYRKIGVVHTRKFEAANNEIRIIDTLKGQPKNAKAIYHIYPGNRLFVSGGMVDISGKATCQFKNYKSIFVEEYDYADSYNKYQKAQRIVVEFEAELQTLINFKN